MAMISVLSNTSCLLWWSGPVVVLMQGNAGLGLSVVIILMTAGVALVAVLSAIGVCERCKMESGGAYFLLAHVLGAQTGAAVGVMYCFGQVTYEFTFLSCLHVWHYNFYNSYLRLTVFQMLYSQDIVTGFIIELIVKQNAETVDMDF